MKVRVILRAACMTTILISLTLLLAWSFLGLLVEAVAAASPARQTEAVISLTKSAQEKGGIVITPVTEGFQTRELRAYGTVLPLQSLAELKKSYALSRAQVENARAQLKVSQKEYARLNTLYNQGQNTSLKALQAAEGTWRVDKNNLLASQEELQGLEGAAQQQWGKVIVSWVFAGSPAFSKLMNQQDFLVQVTLPPGKGFPRQPRLVRIELPAGPPLPSRLVSSAPQTDPRIQGLSFFYLVSGPPRKLLAGMNVTAFIPEARIRGFFIPASAVVWRQGKAVVYIEIRPDRFVAQPVSTGIPVKEGYFVTEGLKDGDRLVVQGAQVFLSEESRVPGGPAED
jgi:hypothetical protein